MANPIFSQADLIYTDDESNLKLDSGSKIAVIGGGPAGSFFSYYILDMAERVGIDLQVDIFEPRDFSKRAPIGCNMCGGIISETLVQTLAVDGINLPPKVVQRGIDSYTLHMDVGDVCIKTPANEKRIGAVTRGPGPRDMKEIKWESFDGHLQKLAINKGAQVKKDRVTSIKLEDNKPQIRTRRNNFQIYDLLVAAVGVNTSANRLFEELDIGYKHPQATKTFICEYYFGNEMIKEVFGSSMHVFLLNIPRLEFAAIIPKGDYVTICMLGADIDKDLIQSFLSSPEVKNTMPVGWKVGTPSCQCFPCINVHGADHPYADRIVFIGDCGVTRLYKDGIGAAYRTAKAAASTAVFQGISALDFQKYYMPVCKSIITDNSIGRMSFLFTNQIQKYQFACRALLEMTISEQNQAGVERRLSTVLWDMFTGSSPYKEIFTRTLHPAFISQFLLNIVNSIRKAQ